MPPEEMKNKVCIITGGGGSIGLASARRMYDAGARIMLVDLNEDNLAIAKASFDDKSRVSVCTADVSVSAETKHYIAKTEKNWGKIDVLFANAGFSGTSAPTTDYPEDIFDKVMAVNVRGSFLACKYALPEMDQGSDRREGFPCPRQCCFSHYGFREPLAISRPQINFYL